MGEQLEYVPLAITASLFSLTFVCGCVFVVLVMINFRKPIVNAAILLYAPWFSLTSVCSGVLAVLIWRYAERGWRHAAEGDKNICWAVMRETGAVR